MDEREAALERAHEHAVTWLASLADRAVPPQASVDEVVAKLGTGLPDGPSDPGEVVDLLAAACEPGLMAIPSGRFFGFVMGGTHPAALAADWLVSAWDQNAGMRDADAGVLRGRGRRQRLAARPARPPGGLRRRLRHRGDDGQLHLPGGSAGRLSPGRLGRRPEGADRSAAVRVLVGAERHDSVDLGLRYLGLGAPEVIAADDQGRMAGGADHRARERRGRPDDRAAAGRQRALRRLRSLRRGDRGGPPAWRLGARRRCLRALRRGTTAHRHLIAGFEAPTPGGPMPTRRSTCPTTAGSRSSRTRSRCAARWACTATT